MLEACAVVAVFYPKECSNKTDSTSYRLICLFPVIGKLLAKYEQLDWWINNVLDSRQYGFRWNRSNMDALHEVVRYIYELKGLVSMSYKPEC